MQPAAGSFNERTLFVPKIFSRSIDLLDRFVFLALLGVLAFSAIPYGSVQSGWLAIIECSIFALGALWAIEGLFVGSLGIRTNCSLLLPLSGILILAFVQTVPLWTIHDPTESIRQTISVDPYQTKLWFLQFGAITLTAALLFRFISDQSRLRTLVNVVICIGLASAAFGIFRHLTHFELPVTTNTLMASGSYGQFINRNHFALLMEMTLGLTVGLIVGGGIPFARLPFYLAAVALLWVALVLSNSRGGIVSMLSQSLFVLLTWKFVRRETAAGSPYRLRRTLGNRGTRVVLAACFIPLLVVGVVWVGGDSLIQRWEVLPRELNTDGSARLNSSRIFIWRATLSMIKSNPVFGVGFGGYRKALTAYHDASGVWIPQEAHNDYLELMASGGIVAAALALWFLIFLRTNAWRCLRSSTNTFRTSACFGAMVGLFGVVVHSFVDFGLHVMVNALIGISLIVIATAQLPSQQDS